MSEKRKLRASKNIFNGNAEKKAKQEDKKTEVEEAARVSKIKTEIAACKAEMAENRAIRAAEIGRKLANLEKSLREIVEQAEKNARQTMIPKS